MFGRGKKDADVERSSGSEGGSDSKMDELRREKTAEDLETIHTNERVGTHTNYYEKDGLRTEGDGVDHLGIHHKMNSRLFLALTALSFLWIGSQIPLYLFGTLLVNIYSDIGGVDIWTWVVIAYSIALAAISPFTGALSDLLGRRYVAMLGSLLIIIGVIMVATTYSMGVIIAGFSFIGVGAGVGELTALAGAGELVPTNQRGAYVGAVIMTITPFIPSSLYAELINNASNWRYVGIFCGVWQFIGLILLAVGYWPPPRVNSEGYSRRKVLQRIDWIGGFLSLLGIVLILAAFQWSALTYSWGSVHVLVTLCVGLLLLVLWVLWEKFGTKHPMIPGRIAKEPVQFTLIFLITFLSGANFYAILLFWPTEAYNVYGRDPIGIGIRVLPIGFGIIFGAVISLVFIQVTKGRIKLALLLFTAMTTAGSGCMSIALPNNISSVWAPLFIGSLGIGGVIVPCAIITSIVCPDDLIATATALNISVRTLGGAIGYAVFYIVYYHKLTAYLTDIVGIHALAYQLIQLNMTLDTTMVTLAAQAEWVALANITNSFHDTPYAFNVIVGATQWAMAEAYRWPYYISVAFGGATFLMSIFVNDIGKYMDSHVAVVVE